MANQKDLVVKMTINSQDFDNGLKNAKNGLGKFTKETETAAGMFKSAMQGMVSAFSTLGVAMAAKNIFKSFMNSTDELQDSWQNNIGAMKDSWSGFLFQINNGNFQGFKDLINYATQARMALDSLGDATALFNLDLGGTSADMTELLSTIQKKKKKGEDYSAELNQYNTLLDNLRNDASISNKYAYQALEGIFGRHGVVLGDYGLTPLEAARQARLAAAGEYSDVEAYRRARNTAPDVSELNDFDITTGESALQKLKNAWGKERFNRAAMLSTLGNITTEEKDQIEKILNEISLRDRTIASMDKQLNRYLNEEFGGGGGGSGASQQTNAASMTTDQIIEYLSKKLQNELLAGDKAKDSLIVDIEVIDDDIIENETEDLVQRFKDAQEQAALLAKTTQMAFMAASNLAVAFNAFGDVSDSTLGKVSKGLGSVITQVVATIQALMALTGAETVEGVAQVFSEQKGDVWVKLAAAGIALAGIMGIIAAAKNSFAGSYAEGGVVGGSSYTGDRLWARVNSGEMILNQKQQAALIGNSGQVKFVIEGSQLKGVLENYETIENI